MSYATPPSPVIRTGSALLFSMRVGQALSGLDLKSIRGVIVAGSNMFNETQAAEVLGCSVALLRKWRLFGEGPAYVKIGRLVRYRQEDLDEFLNSHRVVTGGGR